jgi:type II secretory pathway component GspD/PulD (secretin)
MAQHSRAKTFKLNHPLRQDELKEQLLAAGVEIPTTAYFYLDSGILLVRGSDEQLARVHRLVRKLNGFSGKEIEEADAGFVKDLSAAPAADENSANLFSRTFKVSAHVFNHALRNVPGLQTNNVSMTAYSLFSKLGVDLKPPESVFYNDQLGLLFVRASLPDLDTIENVLSALNDSAPQIHIKARFIEVAGPVAANLYLGSLNAASVHTAADDPDQPSRDTLDRPKFMFTASGSTSFMGIMSKSQFQTAFRTLESTPGVEELAEPEVLTLSGRQTEMRATEILSIITNFVFAENSGTQSNSITPQVAQVETGPILDTIASVSPDGYAIDLITTASLTEFLGYDTPPTKPAEQINNLGDHVPVTLPVVLPSFEIRKATANIKLWDNQTVVLGGMKARFYDGGKEVGTEPDYFRKTKAARSQPDRENKELLVFITVTLVDAAGNRIHSDGDRSFPTNRIPQQQGIR